MKLINKIIPIAFLLTGVGASISTTSCSYGLNINTLDITKPYHPSIEKAAPSAEVSTDVAQKIYMDDVMKNPQIIQQDIWYQEAQKLTDRISSIEHSYIDGDGIFHYNEDIKYNSVAVNLANVSISNVDVEEHNEIINGKQTVFYTLSMSLGYDFKFDAKSIDFNPKTHLIEEINFKSEYENIPLYMYKAEGNWYVSVDIMTKQIDEYLQKIPKWTFAYSYDRNYEYDITVDGITRNITNSSSVSDTFTRRSQIVNKAKFLQEEYIKHGIYVNLAGAMEDFLINYIPYHMQDVACPDDIVQFNKNLSKVIGTLDTERNYIHFEDDQYANTIIQTSRALSLTSQADRVTFEVRTEHDSWAPSFEQNMGNIISNVLYPEDYYIIFGSNPQTRSLKKLESNDLAFGYLSFGLDNGYTTSTGPWYFMIPKQTRFRLTWYDQNGAVIYQSDQIVILQNIEFSITGIKK